MTELPDRLLIPALSLMLLGATARKRDKARSEWLVANTALHDAIIALAQHTQEGE